MSAQDPNKVEILLSWEWYGFYALRNHLYPFWLSLPSQVFKLLGCDTNFLVVNSMYVMHCIVWSFGDYFFYKLVKILAGRKCAIFTLMINLTNQTVNRYISRTSANGIEGNLAIASLYYYTLLNKPKIFDMNLQKMTLLISITFLCRSSSLAPWIPLAFFKIMEDINWFLPILVAGLTVTVPACIVSILIDSYYYGVFTVPQINFVHVNVVENVSKYFGSSPWYFYVQGFRDEFCTIYAVGLFGLCLFTVNQMCGSLKCYNANVQGASRIPSLITFITACLTVLSMVDHKELRFYAPVAQIGCFAQGYALV